MWAIFVFFLEWMVLKQKRPVFCCTALTHFINNPKVSRAFTSQTLSFFKGPSKNMDSLQRATAFLNEKLHVDQQWHIWKKVAKKRQTQRLPKCPCTFTFEFDAPSPHIQPAAGSPITADYDRISKRSILPCTLQLQYWYLRLSHPNNDIMAQTVITQ